MIAVPADTELNIVGTNSFDELSDPIKTIIKTWFTSYKGPNKMEFKGWANDSVTMAEILKWIK